MSATPLRETLPAVLEAFDVDPASDGITLTCRITDTCHWHLNVGADPGAILTSYDILIELLEHADDHHA